MFGSIGGMELLGILAIALILFGPRRLPEIGRTLGKTMQQFRRAANDLRVDLEREVRTDEVKEVEASLKTVSREINQGLKEATRPLNLEASAPTLKPDVKPDDENV